jgi:competence protein ComEC
VLIVKKNDTHHLLLPFMLIGILLYGMHVNNWYFVLLVIPILYVLNNQLTLKRLFFYLLVVGIILLLSVFYCRFILWEHLSTWFDLFTHLSIKSHIQMYVNGNYDQTTSNFINLILFNIKENTGKIIYHHMIDLSIVYLIVVSGFHISILKRIVNHCCRHRLIANIINLLTITFYCYLLNFAVSVARVWLMFILTLIFKRKITNRLDILAMAGLVSIILGPTCVFNIGFCMSYLCTLVILLVYKFEVSNILLEKIFINLAATLISLPFVVYMQKQLSLWVILNSFIFGYVFAFIFVYFLLTFWIIWIAIIQHAVVIAMNFVINANWAINTTIPMHDWSALVQSVYFIVFYLGIRMLKSYRLN